ncbi:MAG TPA: hypothetical protein VFZ65_18145 [Planctomycetota bacterium]|nr:hypothetical protein [Planctomycetota bacterium]
MSFIATEIQSQYGISQNHAEELVRGFVAKLQGQGNGRRQSDHDPVEHHASAASTGEQRDDALRRLQELQRRDAVCGGNDLVQTPVKAIEVNDLEQRLDEPRSSVW